MGERLAVVGMNGSGKTTFIKLLCRLYDPTEGRILLDGHDLKEYAVEDLYSMFGIIFQDFGKYAVSVKENIMFGQITKEPNEDDIRTAAFLDLDETADYAVFDHRHKCGQVVFAVSGGDGL